MNNFLHLAAENKYSKNGAARKLFGPSYFDPALSEIPSAYIKNKIHLVTFSVGFWITINCFNWHSNVLLEKIKTSNKKLKSVLIFHCLDRFLAFSTAFAKVFLDY